MNPTRDLNDPLRHGCRPGGNTPLRAFLAGFPALILSVAAGVAQALDPGEDGVSVAIPISGLPEAAEAVAIGPDGRIVLAGTQSKLARLMPTGTLDGSFGAGGIATHDLGAGQGHGLHAFVRMADGRYVGCGHVFRAGTANDFLIARFNADGSLDAGFDGDGHAAVAFLDSGPGGSLFDQCNAVAVQPDGKIVSAGVSYRNGPPSVALARHNGDGTLDATFDGDGRVVVNAAFSASGASEALALVLQPDGRLLVAGYAFGQGGNSDLLLMRLNADGSLDAGFGAGGITRTHLGSEDVARAMVRKPDGRVVVAGSVIVAGGGRDFVLARYTASGALDSGFGTSGIVTTPIGPSDDIAYALALMPWGRIVAAGTARISTSLAGRDMALAAYNADGTLDRYFGDAGKRMLDLSDFDDIAYGLASDIAGQRFWAVGTAAPVDTQDFVAVEFGLPDTIFRHGFDTATAP